jgi:hypothetical protein
VASTQPSRNLLIVHSVDRQDISDWAEIKRRIEDQAPDIEVRIASNFARNSATLRWQAKRPSLVFSACMFADFRPNGGTVYAGRGMGKSEQIDRLARQGLPVPPTLKMTRDIAAAVAHWGRYVVVKPEGGGKGRDVQLIEARELSARYDEVTMNGRRDMIVQPYVEHSIDGYPTEYRVLTLFGHALYSACNRWAEPRAAIDVIASDPNGVIASNNRQFGRVRTVSNDAEIIALGEKAHAGFPECAVLGVDVIRESGTGKLYVMEVNPEGFTWHFSSSLSKNTFTAEHVRDLYAQFGALDRVARLLIEKTRAEGS